jgi:hypothetical protein
MRRLLVITPLFVVLFVAGRILVPESDRILFGRWAVVASLVLSGLAGSWVGFGFEAGQRLRRAWLANAVSCFLDAFVIASPDSADSSTFAVGVRAALSVGDNAATVLSIWMFGKAYRDAGLEEAASGWWRRAMLLAALVVGCLVAGPPLLHALAAVRNGDLTGVVPAISAGGDIIIFVCLVPIFFAALRLRGGLLAWPWSFFLASSIAWLITDAQFAVRPELADPWIVCSAALTLSAALAQRRILSDTETVA